MPGFDHPVDRAEHEGAIASREGIGYLVEQSVVGVTEQGDRPVIAQSVVARAGHELVKDGQRVPDRSGARPDHHRKHRWLVVGLLRVEYLLKQFAQDGRRDQPEGVVMRSRPDGRDDLLRFGRGEHELQVRRRLLYQLEQGVETRSGHHVRLVDDVDLVAGRYRRVESPFSQIPGIVDAAVRPGPDGASATQDAHWPHGSGVGPASQFSDLARIRALDVLPQPRGPLNK